MTRAFLKYLKSAFFLGFDGTESHQHQVQNCSYFIMSLENKLAQKQKKNTGMQISPAPPTSLESELSISHNGSPVNVFYNTRVTKEYVNFLFRKFQRDYSDDEYDRYA